jgi:hypothetical protein
VASDPAAIENGRKSMAKRKSGAVSEPKRPGVIDLIVESLTQASAPGVSVVDMVERLAAATGRDPAHLTNTVKTQLSRLQKTRGIKVERMRVEGVMLYRSLDDSASRASGK